MRATVSIDLREDIAECLREGAWNRARVAIEELWRLQPNAGTAAFVSSTYEKLRPHVRLAPARVAVLRSFTLEPVLPIVRAAGLTGGLDLTIYMGGFNTYAPELLQADSALYTFQPDVAILAVQTRDVAPRLWESWTELTENDARAVAAEVIRGFRTWIETFRAYSPAHLVVHGLEAPVVPNHGALDDQGQNSQVEAIRGINREIRHIAAKTSGVYYLDYDALVARHGRLHWHDERKWLTMRLPIGAANLIHMAEEWLRFLHPLTGRVSKVLVTDLDNTLWGGVIGEDGIGAIKIGREHPGASYLAVQRALRDLRQRGILLAICSKNNSADALRALEQHPEMLLRCADFAATRINWNDKSANIREIAAELNVGTDAIAFLDDSPVERARVRTELPEALVIELNEDPATYARSVRQCPQFERLTLSSEDRMRDQMYAEQRERRNLANRAGSLEEFYRSLEQRVEIAPVSLETIARVAQLTQKTNQFNLTTRRYSEQQIQNFAASPGWQVYSVRVKDRFGDNGIAGAVIVNVQEGAWNIDTFLLSCRVIGRTVEIAVLSFLIGEARRSGAILLQGLFIPTEKNAPAAEFYPTHGFKADGSSANATLWSLELEQTEVVCPAWIDLSVSGEARIGEHTTV